ncbi:hypothetical protein AUC47_06290 [Microbacterium sp. SZ1]|uniref:hypothetical protein n=1 Tax=Microbacterium sp. SZ1 TaxID=1849736 RepID=UPI000BBCD9C7|nr:hypothetical protein [Microbacterium sp. SZ1]PCE14235.1 hypothetical protein AUC47_06290 [Microbacterium sp. SZ1]
MTTGLLLVIVAIVLACTPLTRAAPGAVSRVEDVVDGSGDVSVYVVERNINVTPRCTLRVRMNDGVADDELARVLESVWAAPGDSPCVVKSVETASRSSIIDAAAADMTPSRADAVAEALLRFDLATLSVSDDGTLNADAFVRTGDFSNAAELVRAAVASSPLEEEFGRVDWSMRWSADSGPYDDATISSDATPDLRLADLFDGLAELRASGALGAGYGLDDAALDAPIIAVRVNTIAESGATAVSVRLTVAGWDAEDLAARGAELAASSRAAEAARTIAALGEGVGIPVGTITANGTIDLLATP